MFSCDLRLNFKSASFFLLCSVKSQSRLSLKMSHFFRQSFEFYDVIEESNKIVSF